MDKSGVVENFLVMRVLGGTGLNGLWKKMSKYHKQKGVTGEKEFAALLRQFGFEGERQGRQFWRSDGRTHEDVEHNVKGIHFEVKRTKEKLDVPAAFRQARTEKPDRIPAVAWRANRQPWRIIQDAEDWLARERLIEDLREALRDSTEQSTVEERG